MQDSALARGIDRSAKVIAIALADHRVNGMGWWRGNGQVHCHDAVTALCGLEGMDHPGLVAGINSTGKGIAVALADHGIDGVGNRRGYSQM